MSIVRSKKGQLSDELALLVGVPQIIPHVDCDMAGTLQF